MSLSFSIPGLATPLRLAIPLRKASPYDLDDFLFSPSELQHKYESSSFAGEHPHFSRPLWRKAVNSGRSELGYWQWVFEQVQADDDTYLLLH
ncbi:hypothetical protein D3C77_574580 [compost metagenome]|nr:hypothetical protein [Pseudomonas sp.]